MNRGYINNQAASVLNKVEMDGDNPIGMVEDNSSPLSANFGTDRPSVKGGAYVGDGSVHILVAGLLATDTIMYPYGGDIVVISDGRIDIPDGNVVHQFEIYRGATLWARYKCQEGSGDITYDSSGNGNHGTIINLY